MYGTPHNFGPDLGVQKVLFLLEFSQNVKKQTNVLPKPNIQAKYISYVLINDLLPSPQELV